jgi:hypothetical protein
VRSAPQKALFQPNHQSREAPMPSLQNFHFLRISKKKLLQPTAKIFADHELRKQVHQNQSFTLKKWTGHGD